MQNIDYYSGKNIRDISPQINTQDPEYFTRLASMQFKEDEKNKRRANRMISFIIALCIVSFTLGLVVGIKFASGSKKEIIDEGTRNAVSNIGNKVSKFINKDSMEKGSSLNKRLFPLEEFPYVIRVGKQFSKARSQEVANYLSNKGHTVIISKNNKIYRIYIGPYRNHSEAEISLKNISSYSSNRFFSNLGIFKR